MTNRRDFLRSAALAGSAAAFPGLSGCALGSRPDGHVVVVGGGYGGATAAKYLRMWSQKGVDVTLVERNPQFISCPISNLVIGGDKTMADITMGYEELWVATLVARGYAVVVTDYEGLGTPGDHPYMNRLSQGHALLDAARAAKQLPGTSLTPNGPVALWGYSQGGGASASALELAPSYAPELDLVGAYVGAPPADLTTLLPFIDGSILTGVLGYVLNGMIHSYPQAEAPLRAITLLAMLMFLIISNAGFPWRMASTGSARPSRRLKQLPRPGTERSASGWSSRSTSRRTMARPRPRPWLRSRSGLCSCTNSWNTSACRSGGMPMPVSQTCSSRPCGGGGRRLRRRSARRPAAPVGGGGSRLPSAARSSYL